MSILENLTELLSEFASVETGIFGDVAPDEYIGSVMDEFIDNCSAVITFGDAEYKLILTTKVAREITAKVRRQEGV